MPPRVQIFLLIVLTFIGPARVVCLQDNEYGPNVKAFLDLMRDEEEELEFQAKNNEIPRRLYVRAKTKIAIMRQTVLNRVKKAGDDIVPELHVVTASEIDQVMENPNGVLRGLKVGSVVEETWLYLGKESRGEVFYVFERIKKN
jgi:hypothetical protein